MGFSIKSYNIIIVSTIMCIIFIRIDRILSYAFDYNTKLTENDIHYILSIGFLGENFWQGTICVIYGVWSNKYGYDKLIIFQQLIQIIGISLECVTNNIIIFIIGTTVSETAMITVAIAYILDFASCHCHSIYVIHVCTIKISIYVAMQILLL